MKLLLPYQLKGHLLESRLMENEYESNFIKKNSIFSFLAISQSKNS